MADDFTILNLGVGGDTIDEESITYGSSPFTRKRSRIVIGGSSPLEISRVLNSNPIGTEYSLITRNIPTEVPSGVVNYYNTAASVAQAATATITYTITAGKTFYLKSIIASSSGAPCKVTVDYGPTSPTIVAVGFYSASNPFVQINFDQPIPISQATHTVINVRIFNNAGVAQDVYSTINGREV